MNIPKKREELYAELEVEVQAKLAVGNIHSEVGCWRRIEIKKFEAEAKAMLDCLVDVKQGQDLYENII